MHKNHSRSTRELITGLPEAATRQTPVNNGGNIYLHLNYESKDQI